MFVRAGQQSIASMVLGYLSKTKQEVIRLEEQAISGLKVLAPSDAPERWNEIHWLSGTTEDQSHYAGNAERAKLLVSGSEDALSEAVNLLKRAKELAVQAASETIDADSRAISALEIGSLRDTMFDLANTQIGERFVFAGQAYDAEAFDVATGGYSGESATPSAIIGRGQSVDTGFDGSLLFQGSVDVFQELQDLIDNMNADDSAAISAQLGSLDSGMGQLLSGVQQMGFHYSRADDAIDTADSLAVLLSERLDEVVGADQEEVYVELVNMRTTFSAAAQIAADAFGAKLFQYL